MYLEDAVSKWVDETLETCAETKNRGLVLSCEEFPCIMYIATKEEDHVIRPDFGSMLCFDEAPYEFQYNGRIAGDAGEFHAVSIRPTSVKGYFVRESVRGLMMQRWR